MPAYKHLDDVRITNMTTYLFGPYWTQNLAEMGAQVVKNSSP